jgi:hypothetical protein
LQIRLTPARSVHKFVHGCAEFAPVLCKSPDTAIAVTA